MNENIRRMIKSMNQWIPQMTNLPSGQVDQDIVKVTIAQTDDVANHGHNGSGAGVGLHHVPPLPGPCAGTPQLSAQAPYNPVSPTAPQTGTTQPCQPQSSTNRHHTTLSAPKLHKQAPHNPVSPKAPQTGTTQPCQPQSSTNRHHTTLSAPKLHKQAPHNPVSPKAPPTGTTQPCQPQKQAPHNPVSPKAPQTGTEETVRGTDTQHCRLLQNQPGFSQGAGELEEEIILWEHCWEEGGD